MKRTAILIALAATVGCTSSETKTEHNTTATDTVTAAPAKPEETAATPPMDSAAMMQAMIAYGTPGEYHKWMASQEGKWNGENKMYDAMKPDAPPTTAAGTMETRMIMGGRYQQAIFKSNMNGMPFEGMAITGYDNTRKKFVSTWIDNMSTGTMNLEGTYDTSTKVMTMTGKCTDPTSGKECDVREVFTMPDDKHQKMEMYMTMPGQKEMKMMETVYTKK